MNQPGSKNYAQVGLSDCRWGHSDPPPAHPTRVTAVTATEQQHNQAPNKERSTPSNWGTGYPKREGASKGHPVGG